MGRDWRPLRNLAPTVLARARATPDHPRAARLLAAVCTMTKPAGGGPPPAIYVETADLIADSYAASPDIYHFCEGLGGHPTLSPTWAAPYERHLRAILGVNRDRRFRCQAQLALASVVQSAPDDRRAEAATLFEQFLAEFDGTHVYRSQEIEQRLNAVAKDELDELRTRAVGLPAPDIVGFDLDDTPMKLGDFRGRAVLLNFWATWCHPCMELVPHEVALVKSLRGQPFEIVGVNSDDDVSKARDAVTQTQMTWRSFRDKVGDEPAISTQWKVVAYPTLYLIDHHGTIRKRWRGGPPPEELERLTRVLTDAARRNVPADAMGPVVAALASAARR